MYISNEPGPGGPRILDVTDFYSDSVSGGVKTYLHAKAQRLPSHGFAHSIVVPGAHDEAQVLDAARLHRVRGPSLPTSRGYRLMLRSGPLRAILERERPSVVEVGSPFIVPALLRRAMASMHIPTIGFYHADLVRTFAEPYVPHRLAAPVRVVTRSAARRFVRTVYDGFDVTVAASRSVAEELRSLGVRRVRHISLGVDLETFHPGAASHFGALDRAALGIEPSVPVGLFVGRFCAEKRLDVVLDGHRRIPLADRPHLIFVGGGPHSERIRLRAESEPRLSVLPYVSDRAQLAALYASADFYVAAGPGETFGLAIGEALACGLPVVTVQRGAAPDRVERSGASVGYTHGDPDSAAQALGAMRRWVVRDRAELRQRARSHAEATLDWNRTVAELADLYRELIEQRAAA
jgi:alpha-1,6-mannosyltransferase